MGCDVAFYIPGFAEPIRVDNTKLSASDDSLRKIAEILYENEQQWKDLTERLKEAQKQEKAYITADDLKREGLMGNTTLHNITNEYTKINWPDNVDDFQFNILLVDNFKYNGKRTYGRVIDKNGKELFIIQNTPAGLSKFANYLKVRELIDSYPEDDEELERILKIIKDAWGDEAPSNTRELLSDFQDNEDKYLELPVKDVDVYTTLLNTLRPLLSLEKKPVFESPLVSSVNARLTFRNDTARIKKKDFYNLLIQYNPDLEKDFKDKGLKQSDILKNEELLKQLVEDYILNQEPEFNYILSSINDTNIVFKKAFKSVQDMYGFTYSTLKLVHPTGEIYKGYNLYSYTDPKTEKTGYLYSRNILTLRSQSKMVGSIEEAKKNIDRKISTNDIIQKTANLIFKFNQDGSTTLTSNILGYQEDTLISSINIPLNSGTSMPDNEQALLQKKLADFYKYYKEEFKNAPELYAQLEEVIDSTEKAAIFIYKINEVLPFVRDFSNGETAHSKKILEVLKLIEDNKDNKKYYYVEKAIGPIPEIRNNQTIGYHQVLKVIPTNDTVEFNTTYNRPEPIIKVLNDVVDLLKNKMKVDIEILTAEQIAKMPEISESAKAFIKDGKIYVNGSLASAEDALHEYTHLFLGVLKAQNFPIYQKLLEKVVEKKDSFYTKRQLRKLYPNLAESDLDEEVFVKRFAEYLAGRNNDSIFKEVESDTNAELKTIFNLATEEDFNTLYKGNAYNIFRKFSSDIGKMISTHGDLDFSVGTVYRKASNWISQQIEQEQIIEKC